MATERLQVKLPAGFDPSRHMDALTKQIEAAHGEGWEITHIDASANAAVAIRQVAVTEIATAGEDKPDSFEVKLAKGTKPSDAERMVTRLEDQYEGFVVTKFEPFLGIAELTKLDRATVRARGAAANALGAKPWDVPIRRRSSDDGWDIELPDTYTPSRHYDKLVEVAEEIIGTVGWTVEADADLLTCSFVPGEPPTFPGAIDYPFKDKVPGWKPGGDDEWARVPLGWNLTRRADDPTDPLYLDTEASPHAQVSGTSGSGKSVMLNALIAGALARGFEAVLIGLPAKAVDFFWMREFCRPNGGWGCHNLDEAVTAMALVYEEGERRARVIAEAGVTKWTELPPDKQFPPILIVVDEVTGLFIQETVPKGLDKDHPLVVEAKEINTKKAMLEAYIAKTAAEMRFVGLKLVLSSQVSSTTTGVSTAIRMNLANKAQPLTARIPVPISEKFKDGWARIGDLEIGDMVFAVDGTPTEVTGLTPVKERPIFGVRFDDGQVIEADGEHLWEVSTSLTRAATAPSQVAVREERLARRLDFLEMLESIRDDLPEEITLKEFSERSGVGLDVLWDLTRTSGLPFDDRLVASDECDTGYEMTRPLAHFNAGDVAGIDVKSGHLLEAKRACNGLPADQWITMREMLPGTNPNSYGYLQARLRSLGCRQESRKTTLSVDRTSTPRSHQRFYRSQDLLDVVANHNPKRTGERQPTTVLRTTQEMLDAGLGHGKLNRFAIDLPGAIETPEADLLVDPYVLGAWLGDGSSIHGEIAQGTTAACTDAWDVTDQDRMIAELNAAGYPARPKPSCSDRMVSVHRLKAPLREIGVLGNKHIPAEYLRASVRQRLALLQGLMDTDGCITERGSSKYCTTSEAIRDGVVELIRSLGIKASVSSHPAAIVERDAAGERRTRLTGSTAYIISFTTDMKVCRLPRKAERLKKSKTRGSADRLYITSVETAGHELVRCIEVAHPRSLYLTGGFIPTHNCILGSKPTDNNRRLSLSDAAAVPKVPEHIASDKKAGRGVGVSEFEGQPPTVFKSFFATTDQYREWLLKLGVPTTDSPRPLPADVAKRTSLLQEVEPGRGDGVERSPISGKPVAEIAERLGDDTSWQYDPETGEKLSGYALSNAARHAATEGAKKADAAKKLEVCPTCDAPVNPTTGECACSF